MGFCKWCMYYTCLRYHSLSRTNRVCIVRPAFSSSRDIRSVALPPTCYYNFPEKKLLSDPIKKRKRSVTSTKTREISSGARSFRMLCKSYLQLYQFQINRSFVILSFQINQEVEFGLLEVLLCFRILCLWFLYYMIHLNVVYCFLCKIVMRQFYDWEFCRWLPQVSFFTRHISELLFIPLLASALSRLNKFNLFYDPTVPLVASIYHLQVN